MPGVLEAEMPTDQLKFQVLNTNIYVQVHASFMFQFPLFQVLKRIKLKTLTSMKLQAGGRSHFWSGARWSEIRGHIRAVIPKLPARSKVTADLLLP
jgi:hypothetical protein